MSTKQYIKKLNECHSLAVKNGIESIRRPSVKKVKSFCDKLSCFRCKLPVLISENKFYMNKPYSASVEHIIPISKGGLSTPNNLALSHALCNQSHNLKRDRFKKQIVKALWEIRKRNPQRFKGGYIFDQPIYTLQPNSLNRKMTPTRVRDISDNQHQSFMELLKI